MWIPVWIMNSLVYAKLQYIYTVHKQHRNTSIYCPSFLIISQKHILTAWWSRTSIWLVSLRMLRLPCHMVLLYFNRLHRPIKVVAHSVIADSALQLAFAAATGNFRSISALKSIHIWSLISLLQSSKKIVYGHHMKEHPWIG